MAKKTSRKVVKKTKLGGIPIVFDCPKCSNPQCIEVKCKRTEKRALLECRVCRVKKTYPLNKH